MIAEIYNAPWIAWRDPPWPDWPDDGRRVQMYLDGRITTGKLDIDDVIDDGEGGEFAIWMIDTDDGKRVSFADSEFWRFIP